MKFFEIMNTFFFFFFWMMEFYHETRVHANVSINQLDVITLDYIYNIFEIMKVNYDLTNNVNGNDISY